MREPQDLGSPSANTKPLSVLLIEDDRGDALLVEELIADADAKLDMVWARTMAQAEREIADGRPDCILLDLHLPDAEGIDALQHVIQIDAGIPIVVLTGRNDEHFGVSAVASGAQDYLVKGRVDPEMLRRALLYAIERKHAQLTAADLYASQLRALENARLERGLVPTPLLLDDPGVDVVAQYRPSRENAQLGGDFYDVVQTSDRTVHVLIGDVAGHGPEEAALGVALRIAWRVLVFAGIDDADRMRQLDRILRAERAGDGTFATALNLTIPADGPVTAVRAGHPGMLLHGADTVRWIEPAGGPALGLNHGDWTQHEVTLSDADGLLLLTDGLFEGHSGVADERLGEDGLLELAQSLAALPGPEFVDALIDGAADRAQSHGGLSDDIAVVRVQRTARNQADR
jgi:serine phosphatase RsbU (regulator of sigma subunit)